ncbi:DUF4145 domain-containing protein [Flavobacterium sp. 5]|uniref:DUF4145 domain-containing protein n=1 Tax=Flavobacterium sp. 5 TaxID=2035199 RepID=UPI000C2CB1F8|nr:DUF4145 domain-containing protein [Flavobacterium sp. 5]PKB17521.1 uncharacterized protein DUF4145 [Flavobacterium sp. 5]
MLVECDNCSALVEAQVIGAYVQEMEYDWMCNLKLSLCKCSQCASPILVEQEYEFDHEENFDWGIPKRIYPGNLFHINPIIPDKLKIGLTECIKCFKGNAYTATAIMCRRTLEGFCLIKGAKGKNLAVSIKKLKEDGIINDQLYDWADELRLAGNEAAHNIDNDIDPLVAKDILDFTIAILDFTYSFKDKFDKFKNREKKK